ncbi:unnamed protein product, partial [Hymenolepis diminuta]
FQDDVKFIGVNQPQSVLEAFRVVLKFVFNVNSNTVNWVFSSLPPLRCIDTQPIMDKLVLIEILAQSSIGNGNG